MGTLYARRKMVLTSKTTSGWHLNIDLNDTALEKKQFKTIEIERTENDWIHCRIEDKKFKGYCGPENLEELISIFLNWANKR